MPRPSRSRENSTELIAARATPTFAAQLRFTARLLGVNRSELITRALQAFIANHPPLREPKTGKRVALGELFSPTAAGRFANLASKLPSKLSAAEELFLERLAYDDAFWTSRAEHSQHWPPPRNLNDLRVDALEARWGDLDPPDL